MLEKISNIENEILKRIMIVLYLAAIVVIFPFKLIFNIFYNEYTLKVMKDSYDKLRTKIDNITLFW